MRKWFILCFISIATLTIVYSLTLKNYLMPASIITKSDSGQAVMEDAVLRLLLPYIDQAVQQHYGTSKLFINPKILELKRLESGQFHFMVTVEIETFEGAHNPPYGIDTITIFIDNTIYVTKFKHVDVSF